jgi:hypothetical protein
VYTIANPMPREITKPLKDSQAAWKYNAFLVASLEKLEMVEIWIPKTEHILSFILAFLPFFSPPTHDIHFFFPEVKGTCAKM